MELRVAPVVSGHFGGCEDLAAGKRSCGVIARREETNRQERQAQKTPSGPADSDPEDGWCGRKQVNVDQYWSELITSPPARVDSFWKTPICVPVATSEDTARIGHPQRAIPWPG